MKENSKQKLSSAELEKIANEMARESKARWWEENKDRFLKKLTTQKPTT